ncbi:MAG: hypothetical protein E6K90_02485 [Thaumarchaeota archaeon]|nr:MAG: hypothetical protein E6K90_02485 [Nitrososphaerota archaeon]
MLSDDEVSATILLKLHKRGNWGASHTAFDNLHKGFKDADLGKHGARRIDKLARELIRHGWIIPKPTSYGLQVSLNPRESQAIMTFMKRFFPDV